MSQYKSFLGSFLLFKYLVFFFKWNYEANESSSDAVLQETAAAPAGVDTIVFTTAEYTLEAGHCWGFDLVWVWPKDLIRINGALKKKNNL